MPTVAFSFLVSVCLFQTVLDAIDGRKKSRNIEKPNYCTLFD